MPRQKGNNKLILIGHTSKPHGLSGEVAVYFKTLPNPENILALRHVFLGDEQECLPYPVEGIFPTGKKNYYLKAAGCDDRNQAMEIAGKQVFIAQEIFDRLFTEKDIIPFHSLTGFLALDGQGNALGKIEDVFELPAQSLAQIFMEGKEVLIPLNETTVLKIEKGRKRVILQLPEGLLTL